MIDSARWVLTLPTLPRHRTSLVRTAASSSTSYPATARHDRIVPQFPFRWYSAPPLLSEWLEVALERGWAYGPGGHALEGKELTIAVSTWSRAHDYVPEGRYGRTMDELTSPYATTAARVGMIYRSGFFVHGVGDLDDAQLERTAREYASWAAVRAFASSSPGTQT